MPIHALEDLDDAFDATKEFLWPVDRTRWIKLAFVMFFLGGYGANVNTFQYNVPADQAWPNGVPALPEIGPGVWVLIGVLIVAALVIGLIFLLIGSIMEFVLIESLRREEVAVRQYWGNRWRQGVRLFGFRLVIGLIVLGSVGVFAALFLLPVVIETGTGPSPPTSPFSIAAFLLFLPVIFVLAIVIGLISVFTTVFVVPIMILEDSGVLAGWGRLWSSIVADPWQYLAYAIAGFVLSIIGGIIVAIAAGIGVLILLIPFGILGGIGFLLLLAIPPLGIGVLAVVGVLFGLSVLILFAIAQVPLITYLRYYALFVLGDADPELDLIPERRAAVRPDDE